MPLLFSATALLGAFLLFCVQPMIAKMVLPQFGGSPTVWTTCLVFFQSTLLAGYSYAHVASGRLGVRRQALLHLGLLALPIAALPIAASASLLTGGSPNLRLLGELLAGAGLPFFVVATTAPLLQKWFASTGHRHAGDPYFLYGAGNAGSLLGLVGYVTLIEPNLALGAQTRFWSVGYGILVLLMVACVVAVWRSPASRSDLTPDSVARIGWRERMLWLALAFTPSSLLMGVTSYLTADLAPVPLLWVVPLTLYLFSFILAFARPPAWSRRVLAVAIAPAVVATLALMVRPSTVPLWVTISAHLATFFLAATACHSDLASRRPPTGRLTEFYLIMSLGGTLGGLFSAVAAPWLFSRLTEYPLTLALAVILIPATGNSIVPRERLALVIDLVLPALLGGVIYAAFRLLGGWPPLWVMLAPLLGCLLFLRRPIRFALSLAIVSTALAEVQEFDRNVVLRERNFFGVLRVMANYPAGRNTLEHGNITHGMQWRNLGRSLEKTPLTYYHPSGPIGQVFRSYVGTPVTRRVGVIGLGIGSLAAYGKPGQEFTFFELDPAIERIARDPRYFRFLEDCRARWRIVLGDARLSMGLEPDQSFGLIVLDAFNGDAVPIHLLTREALRVDLAKLADGGLIALHLSSIYVDLGSEVHALASDAGLVGLERLEDDREIPTVELYQGRMATHWVVLARRPSDLAPLAGKPGWRPLAGRPGTAVWTDDYSNLVRLLKWR